MLYDRTLFQQWRARTAGGRVTLVCGPLWILGFVLWTWLVHQWAPAHGHPGWLRGHRPYFVFMAAVTYWPVAMLVWWLLYPGNRAPLPWTTNRTVPRR